ncbi:MAG TPA: inorganic phosphate transporter [Pyrinomonadaceae bacterium]|jgi:PiT family inorganic phosphate transporter|nr:inorganic phosphate transporter [Pyrinomonadaceae bacterium]
MPNATLALVILIVVVAMLFDYINGFHDAANSIATVVSTRVLSPGVAVVWAAFFNFIAFAVLGQKVAKTIGGDLVDINNIVADMRLYVLLAGLLGAVIWNLLTWYLALPTSSSHALIGGYGGAALAAYYGGAANTAYTGHNLLKPEGWFKTLAFIVASPLMGLFLGFALMVAVYWIFQRWTPAQVDKTFRTGQLFSAAAYSLGHGGNDAQKTMGIVTAVLVAGNIIAGGPDGSLPAIPWQVELGAYAAISAGTLSGGWRIVHTMGSKITKLKPVGGFCAETAGALTLFLATFFGIPVSTTHTITGAIVGVGSTRRLSAVKWGVAGRIVWAWILTIPIAAIIAALCFLVIEFIHGLA